MAERLTPTILLTGAAGTIGRLLRNSLGGQYQFRCFDILPVTDEEDVVVGDIMELEPLLNAMQGVEAVIHLATNPGLDRGWEDVYTNGIGGTYNVFEAARRAGVKKVLYASSTMVLGWKEMKQGKRVTAEMPVNPTTLYGVGKACGEMLARHFVDTHQMSITCLRIGSLYVDPPFPQSKKDDILKAWCSPEDLAQMVRRCLETEDMGFQVFYVVSNNKRRLWDIGNARKLVGFQPKSNAETLIQPPRETRLREGTSRSQMLLMRAAVQDEPGALESWQHWLELVDIEKENLDPISYRLLPLVYHNLAGQKVDHPLMSRLKGVYRRAWLENQLALQQVVPFLTQLHKRGIPVLLLDDLTSVLCLYDGQGARRPYSLDLLVRPDDVPGLLAFLGEQNTWPKMRNARNFLAVETPLEIWPPFDLQLSVAWRALPGIKTPAQALAAWQTGGTAMLGDCPVFTLDLETHFLRCCLRANDARPEAAFFALIDIARMLRQEGVKMDRERVIELVRLNHLVLPVIETLQEIAGYTDMPAAREFLQRLQELPVSRMERLEYRVIYTHQPFPDLFTRVLRRLLLYRRSPRVPGGLGFIRYLLYAWGGGRLLDLPRLVLYRIAGVLHIPGRK